MNETQINALRTVLSLQVERVIEAQKSELLEACIAPVDISLPRLLETLNEEFFVAITSCSVVPANIRRDWKSFLTSIRSGKPEIPDTLLQLSSYNPYSIADIQRFHLFLNALHPPLELSIKTDLIKLRELFLAMTVMRDEAYAEAPQRFQLRANAISYDLDRLGPPGSIGIMDIQEFIGEFIAARLHLVTAEQRRAAAAERERIRAAEEHALSRDRQKKPNAALRLAATSGSVLRIQDALERGADINNTRRVLSLLSVDEEYAEEAPCTPLMLAAEEGHRDAVRYLVEQGANTTAIRGGGFWSWLFSSGQTAETIAREQGHQAIADYLKEIRENLLLREAAARQPMGIGPAPGGAPAS